jgi:hypothetical protein
VGAVLSQRNFFVEGEACGGTQRRAVDARSWPFFTLSSLVLYLARLFLGVLLFSMDSVFWSIIPPGLGSSGR